MKTKDVVPAAIPSTGPGHRGDWSRLVVLCASQSAGACFLEVSDQSLFCPSVAFC